MQNHSTTTDFPLSDQTGVGSAVPDDLPEVEILSPLAQARIEHREHVQYLTTLGFSLPFSIYSTVCQGLYEAKNALLYELDRANTRSMLDCFI